MNIDFINILNKCKNIRLSAIFATVLIIIFTITIILPVYYALKLGANKNKKFLNKMGGFHVTSLSYQLRRHIVLNDWKEIEKTINRYYKSYKYIGSIEVLDENDNSLYQTSYRLENDFLNKNYAHFEKKITNFGEYSGKIRIFFDKHHYIISHITVSHTALYIVLLFFSILLVSVFYFADLLIFSQIRFLSNVIISIGNNKKYKVRKNYISKEIKILYNSILKLENQKKIEERLKIAEQNAKIARKTSKEMFNFLAKMSHEIRTPLTSIIGFSRLINDKKLNKEEESNLNTIRNSSVFLMNVVDEILDFSKISSGKLRLNPKPCSIRSILKYVHKIESLKAKEVNTKISISIADDCPDLFMVDSFRLEQILINLISNSIRFTKNGEITIKLHSNKNNTNNGKLCLSFEIIDTGLGIPKDDISTIFTFYGQVHRIKTKNSNEYEGSGLGLAICKYLVEYMGGTIAVTSEVGKGTNVKFYIYLKKLNSKSRNDASLISSENLLYQKVLKPNNIKILVAEDTPAIQNLLSIIFNKMGYTNTKIVDNGLKLLNELKEVQDYNLIFCDLNMPVMDGISALKKIRSGFINEKYKKIPIAAITADVLAKEECMLLSFNGFINKPVNPHSIQNFINKNLIKAVND